MTWLRGGFQGCESECRIGDTYVWARQVMPAKAGTRGANMRTSVSAPFPFLTTLAKSSARALIDRLRIWIPGKPGMT